MTEPQTPTTPATPDIFAFDSDLQKAVFASSQMLGAQQDLQQCVQIYVNRHQSFWSTTNSSVFVPGQGQVNVPANPLSIKQRVAALGTRALSAFTRLGAFKEFLIDMGVPAEQLPGVPAEWSIAFNADGSAVATRVADDE